MDTKDPTSEIATTRWLGGSANPKPQPPVAVPRRVLCSKCCMLCIDEKYSMHLYDVEKCEMQVSALSLPGRQIDFV